MGFTLLDFDDFYLGCYKKYLIPILSYIFFNNWSVDIRVRRAH